MSQQEIEEAAVPGLGLPFPIPIIALPSERTDTTGNVTSPNLTLATTSFFAFG